MEELKDYNNIFILTDCKSEDLSTEIFHGIKTYINQGIGISDPNYMVGFNMTDSVLDRRDNTDMIKEHINKHQKNIFLIHSYVDIYTGKTTGFSTTYKYFDLVLNVDNEEVFVVLSRYSNESGFCKLNFNPFIRSLKIKKILGDKKGSEPVFKSIY